MSSSLPSKDEITSLFYDEDNITVHDIRHIIECRIFKQNNSWKAYDKSLKYCFEALNIISDLIKLQIFYNESNEFASLNNNIDDILKHEIQFNIDTLDTHIPQVNSIKDLFNDVSYQQWRYKDIAFKAIQKCNKLLFGVDSLATSLTEIRKFIDNNMNDILMDSMTLLTEIWFYIVLKLKWFKLQVISSFIKSKCLLINFELNLILDYLSYSNIYENDIKFKSEVSDNLQRTVTSFNGFISELIDNTNKSIENKDEMLFNESFKLFLNIETMYNHFNFKWLIPEEAQNNQVSPLFIDEAAFNPYSNFNLKDFKQLEHISQYVNNMIDMSPDTETETELESPSYSPVAGIMEHSIKEQQQQPILYPFQIKSSMNCTGSSYRYITNQLPRLLNAFNNVKQLEYDIGNSSNLLLRDGKDKLNISGSSFIKRESNSYPKERSQSMSSSLSTSSTLCSNTWYPPSPSVRSTYNDNSSTSKIYNNSNNSNIENIDIDFNGKPINSTRKSSTKSLPKGSNLYLLNSFSAGIKNSPVTSTPILNKSHILKNELQMLMSMEEKVSIMNSKIIPERMKFVNSTINSTTSNISGFHNSLLNNLYGVNNVKSSSDIRNKLRSPKQ